MSATTVSPWRTTKRPVSVTSPMTVERRPHFSQTAMVAARFSGVSTATMRSCDSLTMNSNGFMASSRAGILATSMSTPTPPRLAISEIELVRPAAPQSPRPTSRSWLSSSRHASMSSFSSKGSPTWTAGRLSSARSSNSWLASTLAPPIPSRPVVEPMSIMRLPGPAATARMMSSSRMTPSDMALMRQLPS